MKVTGSPTMARCASCSKEAANSNTVFHRFASPLLNTLCSSPVTIFLHSVDNTRYPHYSVSPREEDFPILAVRWSYIALIEFLDPSSMFKSALDPLQYYILFSYGAALTSRALRVATLLGAVALGYNIEQIAPMDNSF